MLKFIVALKRKPGMTPEEFRKHYETSHVEKAVELFAHLMVEYRRNYFTSSVAFSDRDPERAGRPQPEGHDVITEIYLKDQAALDEFVKALSAPEIKNWFIEDEKKFLDRDASRMGVVEIVESRVGNQARR